MDSDKKKALLERILERNLEWVSAADSKTSPFLAIDLAMLGVLATLATSVTSWTVSRAAMPLCAAILLGASVAFLAAAAFPRTKAPHRSLIYFGEIARLGADDFVRAIKEAGIEDHLTDLSYQCHVNAVIAQRKYTHVRRAGLSLFISVAPWLISIYTLYDSGQ